MGKDQPQRPENQQNVILFCSSSTRVHEIYQSYMVGLFHQLLELINHKKNHRMMVTGKDEAKRPELAFVSLPTK